MPVGTARSLPARFEVAQGAKVLYARFEAGQDSLDLSAVITLRITASEGLLVKFGVTHSQDLIGKGDIRRSATSELSSGANIRHSDSADLQCSVHVDHSVDLYCEFDVGQDSANLSGKTDLRHLSYAELLGRIEISHSVNLLGRGEVQNVGTRALLARFEVGQDTRDLFANLFVNQGTQDLGADFVVRSESSVDLLCGLSIPTSVELFARFRLRQDALNLSGRLSVRHPAYPVQLKAIFFVGLTNVSLDLRSTLIVIRSPSLELVSGFVVRWVGIPVELFGKAVISHRDSVELLSGVGIRHVGAPIELVCKVNIQDYRDLAARLMVVPSMPGFITWSDPASWINVVVGSGRGFIAMPWVEVDAVIKVTETSSVRVTSARSSRLYKEITFGWEGTCLGGVDLRREVATDDALNLGAACILRDREVKDLPGGLKVIHRDSENLLAGFEIQDSEGLFARFYMLFRRWEDLRAKFRLGQEILDLPAGFIIRQSGAAELKAGIAGLVRYVDLACGFVVRHSGIAMDVKGIFKVGQGWESLPGKCAVRHGVSVELLGKVGITHSVELLGKADIQQSTSTELLGKADITHSVELLARLEVGQDSADLLARVEIGRGSQDLLARAEVGQDSQDLKATFFAGYLDSNDLFCRVYVPDRSVSLFAKFEISTGTIQFSLREHKTSTFNPDIRFNKDGGASKIRLDSFSAGNGSMGNGWCFVVVDRAWLNGKYIRWNWNGYFSYSDYRTVALARIYDGEYDRSSDTDFPSGSGLLLKGNGLLQTLLDKSAYHSWGPETRDVLVDVSGGSQDKCTIFFAVNDAWSGQTVYVDIDWVEINSGAGGSGMLYHEDFDDSVTMEKTGTTGDYGRISEGELP